MANLVKHQDAQAKLVKEIEGVIDGGRDEVEEIDLRKLPYIKAVIMEGLRQHPPTHFVLPHSLTEVSLEGYTIPKNAVVYLTVAEMGWDNDVWENPMEFQPE
ncbi:hypothetical protein AAC387_Pa08g1742 [Persea americana]